MRKTPSLQAGQPVPHFRVQALNHTSVAYSQIWQQKNLLLVLLPAEASAADEAYVGQLQDRMTALTAHDTACVLSRDGVSGVPQPGIVIADRWGEIHLVAGGRIEDLPGRDEIIEWLRYVQTQCPECQGETK